MADQGKSGGLFGRRTTESPAPQVDRASTATPAARTSGAYAPLQTPAAGNPGQGARTTGEFRVQRPSGEPDAANPLRGSKLPQIHRVFLVGGTVIRGELHRMPNARLADHIANQRGVISLTNAVCESSHEEYRYVVVMLSNVLYIEETSAPDRA